MAATDTLTTPLGGFGKLQVKWSTMDLSQRMGLMAAIAAVIAILVVSSLWARTPDWRVLFSNLGERDGGAIIAALEQQQVPYKFSEGGGAILVPGDRVHEIRLRMASQGLPRGGMVGFELMESQKLGISQFHEQVNYQRALEGELTRSVQALSAVAGARVHLAIPKPSVFVREAQKPTASVLLNLHAGRTLDEAQIAGIVHLISASVPNLMASNISVLDQHGNLLAPLKDKNGSRGMDATQLKYVREVEQGLIRRIEHILTPIVGPGSLRAQVTAKVDFSQSEQTDELYKPNTNLAQQAIRSQQFNESASGNPPALGVPGALTNQPPAPATAQITSPATPGAGGAAGGGNGSRQRDTTVNYEIDRTIRHTKQASGAIQRLSIAVVVDHKKIKDKKGNEKSQPLTDAEIKQITDLVREATGFSNDRGDTLSVSNIAFNIPPTEAIDDTPLWEDPGMIATARELAKYLAIAAVIGYLVFNVIKPALEVLLEPLPEPLRSAEDEEEGDEVSISKRGAAAAGSAFEQKVGEVRDMAKQDPKAVANIVKDWMGANG